MHLTAYVFECILRPMLEVLTTDEFGEWFRSLGDEAAEEVAVALEVVERLGASRAAPGSSEWLLWYEHPGFERLDLRLVQRAHEWGAVREYAERVLVQLQSPRFVRRLTRLSPSEAGAVLEAVEKIRRASALRWPPRYAPAGAASPGPTEAGCDELRRWYFEALASAGFEVTDVPAHSSALRELSLRSVAPNLRLLYGVDEARSVALFVLGERLDRSFYGDSVRRAERAWRQFLEGSVRAQGPAGP